MFNFNTFIGMWYECTFAHLGIDERTGAEKTLKDKTLVMADDLLSACNALNDQEGGLDGFEPLSVVRRGIAERFGDTGERFYNAKVIFVVVDAKGREKRQAVQYVVQADDLDAARKVLEEGMRGTLSDWEAVSLSESAVTDIIIV